MMSTTTRSTVILKPRTTAAGPLSKTSIVRRLVSAEPRSMPADDLRRIAAVGAVAGIIDLRSPEAYAKGRIPGSVNIPETKITALVHALTNRPGSVLVCEDGRCGSAVARALCVSGLTDVYYLEGGLADWVALQGPLVETAPGGAERPVSRPQKEPFNLDRLLNPKVLFLGLAASAAMIACAFLFFS